MPVSYFLFRLHSGQQGKSVQTTATRRLCSPNGCQHVFKVPESPLQRNADHCRRWRSMEKPIQVRGTTCTSAAAAPVGVAVAPDGRLRILPKEHSKTKSCPVPNTDEQHVDDTWSVEPFLQTSLVNDGRTKLRRGKIHVSF